MSEILPIDKLIFEKFLSDVKAKYPLKAFGYFVSASENDYPCEYILFNKDIRDEMKDEFEAYRDYYVRNDDAGFLATEQEILNVHRRLHREGKHIVGVFHSHQRHPAIFSTVDMDLHPSNALWHMIISLRNYNYPIVKVFKIKNDRVSELQMIYREN